MVLFWVKFLSDVWKLHLENISADKITDWLNSDKNDIGCPELTNQEIIQKFFNLDKPEANLSDW